MKPKLYFALLFCCIYTISFSQNDTAIAKKDNPLKGSLAILPNLQYAPETSLGLGFAVFYVKRLQKDIDNRPSTQAFYPLYTLKKQITIGGYSDNWFNKNKSHFYTNASYKNYPFVFYEMGYNSPNTSESFTSKFFEMNAYYEQMILRNFYVGLQAETRIEKITKTEAGKILSQGLISGSKDYSAVGFGPIVTYDSRDNNLYPTQGDYHSIKLRYFNKALSTISSFALINADFRKYFPVSTNHQHIIATNLFYALGTSAKIPFQMIMPLNQLNLERGIFKGRYKDLNQIVFQADYRFPIYRRFKGVLFGSASSVAPSFGKMFTQTPHFAGGAGVRYMLGKDGLVIRVDVGFGQSVYPYVDVNEAF